MASKTAVTDHPIHELIADRWSPRAFADTRVEAEALGSLFEAARWAASCFNEQPWRFLVASRDTDPDGHARLATCLMSGNAWAARAPVLALSVAKRTFTRNDKPNRHAAHDVGLAVGNLSIQAQACGLVLHQMGGFDGEKARAELGIPDDHDPIAMIAIGYPGAADSLPDELAARERAPRERLPLRSILFGAGWEHPGPKLD